MEYYVILCFFLSPVEIDHILFSNIDKYHLYDNKQSIIQLRGKKQTKQKLWKYYKMNQAIKHDRDSGISSSSKTLFHQCNSTFHVLCASWMPMNQRN